MRGQKTKMPRDYRGEEPEPPPEPKPTEDEARWSRSDIALLRRAGRSRWNVPEEVRSEAVYQLTRLMMDPSSEDRARVGAAKTLALLDRIDQTDERQEMTRQKLELTLGPREPTLKLTSEQAARAIHAALEAIGEGDKGMVPGESRPEGEEGGAP